MAEIALSKSLQGYGYLLDNVRIETINPLHLVTKYSSPCYDARDFSMMK